MGYCTPDQYQVLQRSVGGVPVPIRVPHNTTEPPTTEQLRVILRTLELVPEPHLRLLSPPGHVQVSRRGCPPRRGGGNGGASRWIRISPAAVGASHNRHLNATLLHELGHLVDTAYGGMRWIQDNDPEGYRLLAGTGHEGTTTFDGERFADCYMIFVYTQIGSLPYNHPADPPAYRGAQATQRFEIMLNSPAFEGWTGALSELRRSAGAMPNRTPDGPVPQPMPAR